MKTLIPAILVVSAISITGCGSSMDTSVATEPGAPSWPSVGDRFGAAPEAAPSITAITPAMGSPAMEVTITGEGFSAETEVFFGGVPAPVTVVSSTELRVHPSVPSAGTRGTTTVDALVDGVRTNGVAFQLFAAGDVLPRTIGTHGFARDLLRLASGEILVIDSHEAQLFSIGTSGWMRPVMTLPEGASRLTPSANGAIVAGADAGLYEFDATARTLSTIIAEGTWSAATDAGNGAIFALQQDGSGVDVISGGVATPAFAVDAACEYAWDISAVGGITYLAAPGGVLCTTDGSTNAAPLALSQPVDEILALRVEDDRIVMLAQIANTDSIFAVEVDGSVMMRADVGAQSYAFDHSQNGVFQVVTENSQIVEIGNGNRKVLAAPLTGVTAQHEAGGRVIVAGGVGGYDLPFLAELAADGATRVIANGASGDFWTDIASDGTTLFVAAMYQAQVLAIDADGAISTAVDHASFGSIASMTQLADGSFLVSDWARVAKYHANGEIAAVVAEIDGAEGIATDGSTLWIAAGTSVVSMALGGGDVSTVVAASEGYEGLNALAIGVDGGVFVVDGWDSGEVFAVTATGLESLAQGDAVFGLATDSFGRILVADGAAQPYVMLP